MADSRLLKNRNLLINSEEIYICKYQESILLIELQ